jgi:hypothetical protein
MFDTWNDGPRTWKYAVPGALTILLGIGAWLSPSEWLALLLVCLGVLTGGITLTNWWKYVSEHNAHLFYERQAALSITPLVLLSQNMKQMHPDAIKVLNRFGVRTSWQVRVDANNGTRDWVLADTNVHFAFIEYLMSKSGTALFPKNRFSEGSKKWDPDGLVDDRTQYDELEKWMFARMMVTRSHGEFKPAEFIPPWTPDLIMEVMGLTGEQDLYRPDEDVKLSGGNGKLPEVVTQKMGDLEQTAMMRAATSQLMKNQ